MEKKTEELLRDDGETTELLWGDGKVEELSHSNGEKNRWCSFSPLPCESNQSRQATSKSANLCFDGSFSSVRSKRKSDGAFCFEGAQCLEVLQSRNCEGILLCRRFLVKRCHKYNAEVERQRPHRNMLISAFVTNAGVYSSSSDAHNPPEQLPIHSTYIKLGKALAQ
ncbi:hypothetical protein NE237_001364 [Protea cynaroides]|uniref:Uncharacterized protein n=1 Tax=Protea cynaroides TaxID=273540 RepID=A0A9Q0QY18_9MAGN|nr:hypothetical protein NE237_001364 [Protea cynaroides]